MSPRSLAVVAVLCGSLLQPALAKNPAALPLPGPFDAASAAASLVEVSGVKALKDLKGSRRVAVPQFSIEFVTQDSVSSETSGFAAAGRASVSGHYRLTGVAEPEFQALTEQLYASFVQALQAQGLEVLTPQQLAASPTWARLTAGGVQVPLRGESSITVAPPGMALYGTHRMLANTSKKGTLAALAGFGAAVTGISESVENVTLQKELDGAALVEVSMKLHFAQLKNENRGFLSGLSNTAAVSARLHPILTHARMTVMSGSEGSTLSTKAPLLLDPAAFTEVRKEAATTGEIAGAVAVGLLRMAIGSKDSSSSEKYEVVAEPQRYRERIAANLAQTHAMLIARMVSEH
ncbi:MAG: hypothetical protein ACT6S0_03655 [Roseateles sp.]|uniref:hypothetical protein n=1 Tax=Roseateles sp. TaxID=1971397 RepID=UPI004036CAFD